MLRKCKNRCLGFRERVTTRCDMCRRDEDTSDRCHIFLDFYFFYIFFFALLKAEGQHHELALFGQIGY